MTATDEQLVEAALGGDGDAFPELVRRYQSRLFRFLLVRASSRADAEDALQDTFIAAFRYLASFDPRWRFSTWLYRIGLREAARGSQVAAEELPELVDAEADPLAHCIRESGSDNLWRTARRCLAEEAYTALWLRYVEDMSVRDVARAMDRKESWAKVTLMRARERLAKALSEIAGAESRNADSAQSVGGGYG